MLNKYEITELGAGIEIEEVLTSEFLVTVHDQKRMKSYLLKADGSRQGLMALSKLSHFCDDSVDLKVIHPLAMKIEFQKFLGLQGLASFKSATYLTKARSIFTADSGKLKLMADFKTRILIVDDSQTIRSLLEKIFAESEDCEVVGSLADPTQVMAHVDSLKPDVMTLDIHMPKLTGVDVLRQLMPKNPIPTVMISSIGLEEGREVLTALELGAVDYIQKPTHENRAEFKTQLLEKIRIAACVNVRVPSQGEQKRATPSVALSAADIDKRKVICIGSSTGGTEAIRAMFRSLPSSFPPILITQHIPKLFSLAFAESLKREFKIDVFEAKDGQEILPNQVLIAPGGLQMEILSAGAKMSVRVFDGPAVNRHKPSVDVLFDSAAKIYGKNAIGIILTGMGSDGAKGLKKMRDAGAATLGQNEQTSIVYGMPKVAFELGAVEIVLPIHGMTSKMIELCRLKK